MKKNKLLLPMLGLATLSSIALPLVSCGCKEKKEEEEKHEFTWDWKTQGDYTPMYDSIPGGEIPIKEAEQFYFEKIRQDANILIDDWVYVYQYNIDEMKEGLGREDLGFLEKANFYISIQNLDLSNEQARFSLKSQCNIACDPSEIGDEQMGFGFNVEFKNMPVEFGFLSGDRGVFKLSRGDDWVPCEDSLWSIKGDFSYISTSQDIDLEYTNMDLNSSNIESSEIWTDKDEHDSPRFWWFLDISFLLGPIHYIMDWGDW